MKRIHIVGCGPRTGTTLLIEMMSTCFDIDLSLDHDERIAKAAPRRGKVFLTKSPKDIVVIEPILKMVKNLFVIYMIRDPRDMMVSKHGHHKDQFYGSLSLLKKFHPFAEAIKDHPRVLFLRYEDLVQKPDEIQSQIKNTLPFLTKTYNFSEFHKYSSASHDVKVAMGSLRPVDSESVGNWKNHKARVAGQIQKHGSISNFLVEYGYEVDASWEKELEGIKPDLTPSFHPFYAKRGFINKKLKWKNIRAIRVWVYQQSIVLGLLSLWHRLKHHKKEST